MLGWKTLSLLLGVKIAKEGGEETVRDKNMSIFPLKDKTEIKIEKAAVFAVNAYTFFLCHRVKS